MRVKLIDIDSTMPNLALMKLSAYHKKNGDTVGFNVCDPEKVYVSVVFAENKWKAEGQRVWFPDCEVVIGGSGYDLQSKLPDEVEHIMPDYSLYPDCDYSMGFATRGCIRKCKFCIVPKKEGKLTRNCGIYEFWNTEHKYIMLLDNNILGDPEHFFFVTDQILKENLSVDFNQGLDMRLVSDEIAKRLHELRVKPSLRFAWDDRKDEKWVRRCIDVLQRNGIKRGLWYVLVGFNSSRDDDLYRLNTLKDLGQRAYVMRYRENTNGVRWYNDLAAWANQQSFFMSLSFDDFVVKRHNRGS